MRWIALFYLIIIKINWVKLNALSCLGGTARQKLLTWRKIIPPKWDLIYVEVRSHLGRMNQFSYKRFVFTRRIIPLCRDLAKVRRRTWVVWFFLYKPLLKIYFWWYKSRQLAENYFSVKVYTAFCLMINAIN